MIVARHSCNRHTHCVVRALVVVIERCLTRTSDVSRRDIPRTNRLSAGVKVRFCGVTRAKSLSFRAQRGICTCLPKCRSLVASLLGMTSHAFRPSCIPDRPHSISWTHEWAKMVDPSSTRSGALCCRTRIRFQPARSVDRRLQRPGRLAWYSFVRPDSRSPVAAQRRREWTVLLSPSPPYGSRLRSRSTNACVASLFFSASSCCSRSSTSRRPPFDA